MVEYRPTSPWTVDRGRVAQLVEQRTENPRAEGSSPPLTTSKTAGQAMNFKVACSVFKEGSRGLGHNGDTTSAGYADRGCVIRVAFSSPANKAPMRLPAFRSFFSDAWAYHFSVMAGSECPKRVCTVFTSTPLARSWVAWVWRSSWNLRSGKPCSSRQWLHHRANVVPPSCVPVAQQKIGVDPVWAI